MYHKMGKSLHEEKLLSRNLASLRKSHSLSEGAGKSNNCEFKMPVQMPVATQTVDFGVLAYMVYGQIPF